MPLRPSGDGRFPVEGWTGEADWIGEIPFDELPQFVDPASANATVQLIGLGLLFVVIGLITDGAYALAGGAIGGWLRSRPHLERNRHLVTGATYIGLGIAAALSGRGE